MGLGVVTIAYTADRWTAFGAAAVAAGATLSGFVFVAVSINLDRILSHPSLPARAWQTLGLFVVPVLIGFFLLVPGQSHTVLAWELIVSAVLLGGVRVAIDLRAAQSEKDTPLPLVGRLGGFVGALAPALVSYVCLAVAGATLLAQDGGGLYWLVPSVLVAFFFGLINAWALLVEIPL
jgi:modulator of FtsH protease